MKKLVLTAAILMGFAMCTYAQHKGGLFGRGPGDAPRGGDAGLWLPTHNINGNWDAEDEPENPTPGAPLGGGALLLMGFGTAYALSKRKKED